MNDRLLSGKLYGAAIRLAAIVLLLAIPLCNFPALTARAAGDDFVYTERYNIKITLKTVTDADGWNNASISLYGRGRNARDKEEKLNEWTRIHGLIDDEGDSCICEYESYDYFPSKVVVYTDFGGGFTWRSWEGSVKIYVNDVNIKTEIIRASSSPFSSSSHNNTVVIDRSNYPYPERINVITSHPSSWPLPKEETFDTFYQAEGEPYCSGYVLVCAYDQYGHVWDTLGHELSSSNLTDPENDSGKCGSTGLIQYAVEGQYAELVSRSGVDHKSVYQFTYPTPNSLYPIVSRTYETTFIFRNSVDIVLGGEKVFSASDYKGKFLNIPEDTPGVEAPEGYRITGFAQSGAGTVSGDSENGFQYTFGAAPSVLTAKLTPVKYSIEFDGNGAQSGSVKKLSNLAYDKMQKLPSCAFSKPGYKFTGWNTEPDGSGEAFANVSFVSKLSKEDGSTVTLYAQWERIVYDVTLVYPEELGISDEVLQVGQGDSVPVNEVIYSDSEDGHYEFVSADRPLDNIRAKTTINLIYEKKAHDYGADNINKEATCTETGEVENVCEVCGYVKTSETPVDEHKHDYGDGEWMWSEDYRSASVSVSCSRCGITLAGNTADNVSVEYFDNGLNRDYTARVSIDAGDSGIIELENKTTRADILEKVSFIDENGLTKTVSAVQIISAAVPEGEYCYVDGSVELSETLNFTGNTKLILCDGASLAVDVSGPESKGVSVYDPDPTENNTASLVIYGQENNSGALTVKGGAIGIECGSYAQYGGKVSVDASSGAILADAPSAYGGSLEVYGGELDARSAGADALVSGHGDVILAGGKVTAGGGWGYSGVVSSERTITLGCAAADDHIKASAFKAADISVLDEQLLTDGFSYYSGDLDDAQVSALGSRKLTRFAGKVPSDTDAAAVGTLFGNGSLKVVILGSVLIAGALAAMLITAIRRKRENEIKGAGE